MPCAEFVDDGFMACVWHEDLFLYAQCCVYEVRYLSECAGLAQITFRNNGIDGKRLLALSQVLPPLVLN